MLSTIRVIVLALLTSILVACTPGEVDGDSAPNFAGNYNLNLTLASNNCNANVDKTITGSDTVSQDGRSITVGLDGDQFKGSVDADNGGFSASFTESVNGIPAVGVIAFRTSTPANTYAAKFTISAGACAFVYTGTATKI